MKAVFTDQGFGSLDPRALEEAIETFCQLQESGGVVGGDHRCVNNERTTASRDSGDAIFFKRRFLPEVYLQ